MAATAHGSVRVRNNPFARESASPSPAPSRPRPQSGSIASPQGTFSSSNHVQNSAFSPLGGVSSSSTNATRRRAGSGSHSQSTSTFAPTFIRSEQLERAGEALRAIEGENDFSGKRYVWLGDPNVAFIKGWVIEELGDDRLLVQCDDGSVCPGDGTSAGTAG